MEIKVELFGIARERAGVSDTTARGRCLGDILGDLSQRFPRLASTCLDGRRLRAGYTANISGQRFETNPDTELGPDDFVLLLSVDAGG